MLDRVQILIPMTGSGTRFKAAGYKTSQALYSCFRSSNVGMGGSFVSW